MKFAYGFPLSAPLSAELLEPGALATLAQGAERAGFDAAFLTEHPAPSQKWREAGGHDALDPFVALAFMAQATTTLKLLTNLTVVPYRNPFLLAKAAATLDVLSGGRLIMGAGVGYQKSEFAALGVNVDDRNGIFDEYLEVLKRAWTGEPVTFDGQFVSARGVTAQPVPVQQPRPPIWLGGNSQLTRRRVAERADGWMPMPSPRGMGGVALETTEDLVGLLDYLFSYAKEIGRSDPLDILCVFPASNTGHTRSAEIEMVEELSGLGVTWMAVNGEGTTLEEACAFLDAFGEEVIHNVLRSPV